MVWKAEGEKELIGFRQLRGLCSNADTIQAKNVATNSWNESENQKQREANKRAD